MGILLYLVKKEGKLNKKESFLSCLKMRIGILSCVLASLFNFSHTFTSSHSSCIRNSDMFQVLYPRLNSKEKQSVNHCPSGDKHIISPQLFSVVRFRLPLVVARAPLPAVRQYKSSRFPLLTHKENLLQSSLSKALPLEDPAPFFILGFLQDFGRGLS